MARVWSWALCFLACIATQTAVLASQFIVGGSNGWTVPASGSNNNTFNQWAARNRFQVGDTILFKYDKTKDSVLQVTPESYNTCNTSGPIKSHTDGNTLLKFSFPGPYHFISGNQSRCRLGEKLILVVITPLSPAPSPTPTAMIAPVPSPTPTAMIAPTPTAMIAPAPSPTPTAMIAPATSPTSMPSPSPSPSPSMASPSLSPSPSASPMDSSPSPTPITSPAVPLPSPTPTTGSLTPAQTPGSPTVPSSGAVGGANGQSPSPGPTRPTSSTERFTALPSLLNVVIPLVFAALLNFRIASI